MNGAGNEFLSGAGFAGQHNAYRVVQDLAEQPVDCAHPWTVAYQAIAAGAGTRRCSGCEIWLPSITQAIEQLRLAKGEPAKVGQRGRARREILMGVAGSHQ